jgi:hypothetical protein
MKPDRKYGSNFDEEPLSFEEFLQAMNNFFYNFCGYIVPKGHPEEQFVTEKTHKRNYYYLKKFDLNLADKIQQGYEKFRYHHKSLWDDGYKAYLILRMHTDDPDIQEMVQQRENPANPDDYEVFFS